MVSALPPGLINEIRSVPAKVLLRPALTVPKSKRTGPSFADEIIMLSLRVIVADLAAVIVDSSKAAIAAALLRFRIIIKSPIPVNFRSVSGLRHSVNQFWGAVQLCLISHLHKKVLDVGQPQFAVVDLLESMELVGRDGIGHSYRGRRRARYQAVVLGASGHRLRQRLSAEEVAAAADRCRDDQRSPEEMAALRHRLARIAGQSRQQFPPTHCATSLQQY